MSITLKYNEGSNLFERSNESTKTYNELVTVREYDEETDKENVEEMEKRCEVGQQGIIDLPDDPLCRIRLSSVRVMMVAEYGSEKDIVGTIRGCVKTVTSGKNVGEFPIYTKVAYALGLRVYPSHRRYGIGTKLVHKLEEWCRNAGTTYVYMATNSDNKASFNLFTHKCNYNKFRSLTVLVQPVHAHYKPLNSKIDIVRLPPPVAASIYLRIFQKSIFFPKDINSILSNKISLGTFIAAPRQWDPQEGLPHCYAILSVWDTKRIFKLQFKGASEITKTCCLGTRVLDACLPWLRMPSIPNFFSPFGFYFLFGLHMKSNGCLLLMRSLCNLAHNMARDDEARRAIVAEVAMDDPMCESIPYWKSFSWEEDRWCIKKLNNTNGRESSNVEHCEVLEGFDFSYVFFYSFYRSS